jgi:hypothetical protein
LTISKGEPKTTKQFPERNITPQKNLEKWSTIQASCQVSSKVARMLN